MKTLRDELIGENVEIFESTNPQLQGLKGKIVDETKFTFKLVVNSKIKTILKRNNIFIISGKKIDGNNILKRPEERIKLRA
jgi:ribonuclease P protein subunit POP4